MTSQKRFPRKRPGINLFGPNNLLPTPSLISEVFKLCYLVKMRLSLSVSVASIPAHQRSDVRFLSQPANSLRPRVSRNTVNCKASSWRSRRQADVRCRFQQSGHSVLADTSGDTRVHLDDDKYSWERNWYPVAIVADVDGSKPIPLTLLGKKLVLWQGSDGEWNCVADRCAHRYAPLSGTC